VNGPTKIWERLFLGSLLDAEALASSNLHGITTVITLCAEPVRTKSQTIIYLRFPIDDTRALTATRFDAIIHAIAKNIPSGTVLLHCSAGASRSPILTAAWMHAVGYKPIDAALMEIARLRPILDPSPNLLTSVMELLQRKRRTLSR